MSLRRLSLLLLPLLAVSLWYAAPWSALTAPTAAPLSAAASAAAAAPAAAGFFERAMPGAPSGDEALAAVRTQNAADQKYAQLLAPQLQQQIEQREKLLAKARQDRTIRVEDIARVEADVAEMRRFQQELAQRGVQR